MNEEQLLEQLRGRKIDARLGHDLWPQFQQRMERQNVMWTWWDWAIAVSLGAVGVLFPELAAALLYHL